MINISTISAIRFAGDGWITIKIGSFELGEWGWPGVSSSAQRSFTVEALIEDGGWTRLQGLLVDVEAVRHGDPVVERTICVWCDRYADQGTKSCSKHASRELASATFEASDFKIGARAMHRLTGAVGEVLTREIGSDQVEVQFGDTAYPVLKSSQWIPAAQLKPLGHSVPEKA